jgi:formylglycine-generating enzyme required for sulfatase activity
LYTPEGFVLVSAGTFNMGSNSGKKENKPVHEVTITKPFYMGKYEVTQAEYESVIGTNPSGFKGDEYLPAEGELQENRPVENVSWYDIIVYCNKRSLAEDLTPCYSINESVNPSDWGEIPTETDATWNSVVCDFSAEGYRLPTEAEWEYAARAGDNTVDTQIFSGTNNVDKLGDYAWYSDNSGGISHEVGKKLPNAFGLYDMSGNVWEFCWNWFTNEYVESEGGFDPTGDLGSTRIVRGGWSKNTDECNVFYRNGNDPYSYYKSIGFRVARSCPNTTE